MSASSGRAPGFPSSNGLIRLTQAENLPVEHQKLQAQILKDLVTGKSLESALEHSCTTRVAAEVQTIDSVILEAENHLALMAFLGASAQQNGNWIDFKPEFEPEFQIWTAKEAKRRQFFYVIIDVSMYRVDKSRRVSRLVSRHSQTTLFHLLPPLKALLGTTSIRQSTTKSTNDSNDNRFAPDRLPDRQGELQLSYSWATFSISLSYM